MTPALLFALVDAVLRDGLTHETFELHQHCHYCGVTPLRARVGWWRSLWPLGGGA